MGIFSVPSDQLIDHLTACGIDNIQHVNSLAEIVRRHRPRRMDSGDSDVLSIRSDETTLTEIHFPENQENAKKRIKAQRRAAEIREACISQLGMNGDLVLKGGPRFYRELEPNLIQEYGRKEGQRRLRNMRKEFDKTNSAKHDHKFITAETKTCTEKERLAEIFNEL